MNVQYPTMLIRKVENVVIEISTSTKGIVSTDAVIEEIDIEAVQITVVLNVLDDLLQNPNLIILSARTNPIQDHAGHHIRLIYLHGYVAFILI